jgi:hypothetical protein
MHTSATAQMAFIFGGLLSQYVTFEGLAAFDGSTWTYAEAFLRRALGLHFGHLTAPSCFVLVRRLQTTCSLAGPEPLVWGAIKPTTLLIAGDQTDNNVLFTLQPLQVP